MTRNPSRFASDFCRMISYHEAGHAVVARLLGVEVTDVDVTTNDVRSVIEPGCRCLRAGRISRTHSAATSWQRE
jgi:hypothetical protein